MGRDARFSLVNMLKDAEVDPAKWSRMPSKEEIAAAARAIENRGIKVICVKGGDEALERIKDIIPPGSEVMHGSSTTLIEIGYEDHLRSGRHGWRDLRLAITSEDDDLKRRELRRRSVAAEYFLSGVNAIAMTGEVVACDATGSRVGAWPFAAKNLLLVSGANKIVPTLQDALDRLREYVYPLEDARSRKAYGSPSLMGKCVILMSEGQKDRITLILIEERLGY